MLDQIRNGVKASDQAAISTLLKAIDAVRGMVNDIACQGDGKILDLSGICERLVRLAEESQPGGEAAPIEASPAFSLADELERFNDGEQALSPALSKGPRVGQPDPRERQPEALAIEEISKPTLTMQSEHDTPLAEEPEQIETGQGRGEHPGPI